MKPFHLRRRARAAQVAISKHEQADRDEREAAAEAATTFDKRVKERPLGVWFPQDDNGASWVPSFFKFGK